MKTQRAPNVDSHHYMVRPIIKQNVTGTERVTGKHTKFGEYRHENKIYGESRSKRKNSNE